MGVGGVALNEVDVGGRGNAEQAYKYTCNLCLTITACSTVVFT